MVETVLARSSIRAQQGDSVSAFWQRRLWALTIRNGTWTQEISLWGDCLEYWWYPRQAIPVCSECRAAEAHLERCLRCTTLLPRGQLQLQCIATGVCKKPRRLGSFRRRLLGREDRGCSGKRPKACMVVSLQSEIVCLPRQETLLKRGSRAPSNGEPVKHRCWTVSRTTMVDVVAS